MPVLRKDLLPPPLQERRYRLKKEFLPEPKWPPVRVFRKEFLEDIFKFLATTDHKFLERHGTPGNYSYVYPPKGSGKTRVGGQEDDKGDTSASKESASGAGGSGPPDAPPKGSSGPKKGDGPKKPSVQEWLDALKLGKDTPKDDSPSADDSGSGADGGGSEPPDEPPKGGDGPKEEPPKKPDKPTKHRDDGPNLEIETKESFLEEHKDQLSRPLDRHGNSEVFLWQDKDNPERPKAAVRFFDPDGEADTLEKRQRSVELAAELGEDGIAPPVFESRVEGTDHDHVVSAQGGESYQTLKHGRMEDGKVVGKGSPEQIKAMERVIIERYKELHLKGIAHKDPHEGNQIAWGENGMDARLIDFDSSSRDPVEAVQEVAKLRFVDNYVEGHQGATAELAELKEELRAGVDAMDALPSGAEKEKKAKELIVEYYKKLDGLLQKLDSTK